MADDEILARRARGTDIRRRAQGARADDLHTALSSLDPELAAYADEFIFGQVWSREGLGHEERVLVAVTALAIQGRDEQLRNYLHGALQDGIPAEKLHEALLMLVVYAGFPTALGGLAVLRTARAAHERAQGSAGPTS
jgi:4-carboxymuconolactone decarboxylase